MPVITWLAGQAFLGFVPAPLRRLAAKIIAGIALVLTVLALFFLAKMAWHHWLNGVRQDAIDSHEEVIASQVDAKASEAAAAASEAVTVSKSKTEKQNDEARAAASSGIDPLGDGLRSLRHGQGTPAPHRSAR